ncbi:MAG: hypothetical protein IKZ55_11250 [Bacteroidales bacterium]|nr:hypothetical protein [Bacteroidales bacterium]
METVSRVVLAIVIPVTCVIPVTMVGNMSIMGYIFAALTALATAITAVVAYFALKNEKGSRQYSVFSDSVRVVLDGIKNSESQDYILSNKYYQDIETIQCYLGARSKEKIGLVDFEEIVINDRIKDGLTISEEEKKETKERLRKSYKKIEYFCERMEYLGILSEDKSVRPLILDYYGQTIIKSYERLYHLIIKTRKDRNAEDLFMHFTQLYNYAIESKKHK